MKKIKRDDVLDLLQKASHQPQECMMMYDKAKGKTSIGVPREANTDEKRVALTPSSVCILTSHGYHVVIETRCGFSAGFTDNDYSEAGATITSSLKEVFESDIIIKIAFPTLAEIEMMKNNQMMLSAINIFNLEKSSLQALMNKNITALAYEYIRDQSNILPVIQSMSEIAGKAVIFIAAEYISGEKGKGLLFGGITGVPPIEVVILGAGTVGQYAAKTALSLGATVKVFDNSLYKLRRLRAFNDLNIFSSVIHPDILSGALKTADVVIGAIRPLHGSVPCMVTEDMVMNMKEKSILIDVSIDQGGCFETSEVTNIKNPVFTKHGVIHYCVPNIPSFVPHTASIALSNIITPMLLDIIHSSGLESYLWEEPYSREGIYLYKGILTNMHIGSKFNITGKSLDLLLTSNL